MLLTSPVISLTPSSCFSVSSYEILDNASSTLLPYIIESGLSISINSQNWSLKTASPHTVKISAELNNSQKLLTHTFTVNFFDTCASLTPTVITNLFTSATIPFNLLALTGKNIALPTLTITPAGCNFKLTWKVKRKSDDADMTFIFPTVFAITQPNLVLSHIILNFS